MREWQKIRRKRGIEQGTPYPTLRFFSRSHLSASSPQQEARECFVGKKSSYKYKSVFYLLSLISITLGLRVMREQKNYCFF